MKIKFTKMHGIGNDFIVLDLRKKTIPRLSALMIKLSDRRFGIGFDQALILKTSNKADFRMDIYNGDGSRVEMCGNGIRCLASYIWNKKLKKKDTLEIETDAGIIRPRRVAGGKVEVDMGLPVLDGKLIPTRAGGTILDRPLRAGGRIFRISCVSMGNPHCVIFVNDVDKFDVKKYGALIEKDRFFPNRVNVEFVEVLSPTKIKMRVWERGAGETLACGTGASASVVATHMKGLTRANVTVVLKGGTLRIRIAKKDGRVFMTGPAQEVFEGVIDV